MRAVSAALLAVVLLVVGAGCGGDGEEASAEENVLRIAVGQEPPSLDPGLLTDVVSANIVLNLMDPLVKLDENLEPEAALAESWDVSEDGTTVTYHLRDDGSWSNGDPVTAADFEYSWKRILDPELAAGYAYQFYGVVGATEYNSCEKDCDALRDKVGVKALDDQTLEVKLTSQQPWFIAQSAHASFLPVHQATVEQYGDKWTERGEHRHERAVPADLLEAQGVARAVEVGGLARRGRRRTGAHQRADHGGSHDGACRVRGGRDRGLPRQRVPPDRRDRASPGRRRLRSGSRPGDVLPRLQPEVRAGREPAPRARVRARPDVDRRERDEGGRGARDELHAEGDARLRCDHAGLSPDDGRSAGGPRVPRQGRDAQAEAQRHLHERRSNRRGPRGRGAGDVEGARDRDDPTRAGLPIVPRAPRAAARLLGGRLRRSGGSATTWTTSTSSSSSPASRATTPPATARRNTTR